MKNFESTFNRWLDGELDEVKTREFEAGLDEETLRAANVSESDFWIMGHGETRWLDSIWK